MISMNKLTSNPKKQFLLFGVFLLLTIIIVGVYLLKSPKPPDSITLPSATPIPTQETISPLSIIFVDPPDQSIDVELQKPITVTFNRKLSESEISFAADPKIEYSLQTDDNKLIIIPNEPYQESTIYTYLIKSTSPDYLPKSYSFQTLGTAPVYKPDTKPPGAQEKLDAFQKENHPDVYLSNRVPYVSGNFEIMAEFKKDPEGHFAFVVYLKTPDPLQGKKLAHVWLISQGLSEDQIKKLDISYSTK